MFNTTNKLLKDHQRNLDQKKKDMMMEMTLFNKKRANLYQVGSCFLAFGCLEVSLAAQQAFQ